MSEKLFSNRSFLDPMLVNRLASSRVEAVVSESRTVIIDGYHTLHLADDSKFMPGDQLMVSMGRDIVASLKRDVEARSEMRKIEVQNLEEHNSDEVKIFIESEIKKVDRFLSGDYKKSDLIRFFDELYAQNKKLYAQYRMAFDARNGVELALLKLDCFTEVIQFFIDNAVGDISVPYHLEYAFSPNENTGSKGKYHVVVDEALSMGRFNRKTGQSLCQTKNAFSGLSGSHNKGISPSVCKACLERMIRLSN